MGLEFCNRVPPHPRAPLPRWGEGSLNYFCVPLPRREEGRRAGLEPAFGVVFTKRSSIEEGCDEDGRGATLLSFEEIAGVSSSPAFVGSATPILVGEFSFLGSPAFNGAGLIDLLMGLFLR